MEQLFNFLSLSILISFMDMIGDMLIPLIIFTAVSLYSAVMWCIGSVRDAFKKESK